MHQRPRPSFSLYIGLVISLIPWAFSLLGVAVNLWLGCALWAVVIGLFIDFVWRSEWTANKSKLAKGALTGGVVVLMVLVAWKPVVDQYEREHPKAVAKHEPTPQLQAKLEPPRETLLQPKETKQEQPVKVEAQNDIKLIFKNSPLFTDARKQKIAHDMNSFYLYLIQIGFNAPKEVPPLGTYTKDMWFGGSQPIYEHSIFIRETEIDDPSYIARVYARFAFRELLKVIDPDEIYFIQSNSNQTIVIYEDYFISSYFNKPPSLIRSYNWMAALWEIRQKFGKELTDKMLYYAFKTIIDNPPNEKNEEFDLYFIKYLRHGVFILDNDRRNMQTIQDVDKIIKSHVQMPSK